MLIKNARVITREEEFLGTVEVTGDVITGVSKGATAALGAIDWGGDYLMPGFVEVHTDNLEKHLAPRPGVLWNIEAALVIHDAQTAACGITTVFDALAIGDRSSVGLRERQLQRQCAQALLHLHDAQVLRAEHLLHLRCEVATEDVLDAFDELRDHPLLSLVSVMDHTPGQRQWRDPAKWRAYQERHGKWSDEKMQAVMVELAAEQEQFAAVNRREIVARSKALGLPLASHDDTTVEHVEEAAEEGITLSEFPTTEAAARAARARGLAIIMGAPNLVRGGSHSGNVSARDLAAIDLMDILSSDYVPASLLQAVFDLERLAGWSLPRSTATVSWNAALAVGLTDRGAIEPGLRADLVRVRRSERLPIPLETFRAGRRIA